MIETATTPIGFLPGIIWVGSHILYTYRNRDERFINCVVDYLMAGVEHGELAVCFIEQPYLDQIAAKLTDRCSSLRKRNRPFFVLQAPEESFLADGILDVVALEGFWRDKVMPFCPNLRKVRLFSDTGTLLSNRISRLKLIEFEARMNYSLPASLALCAYDADATGRSMLTQARSVHPFIANARSIRINTEYVQPAQFLSAFYRFVSISKEYTALPAQSESVAEHLAEVAARTPLTIPEIFALSRAATWIFTHLVERNHSGGNDSDRIHVTFASESDMFRVTITDKTTPDVVPGSDGQSHGDGGKLLAGGLVDDISLQISPDGLVITLIKRYIPFKEWAK